MPLVTKSIPNAAAAEPVDERSYAIGPYRVAGAVVLAPMAGLSDAPFRRICLELGAGLVVGEMASSSAHLAATDMTQRRMTVDPDDPLPVVQLLGADPDEMARAAEAAAGFGAKVIDINFGCPARVVCGKACGSAIMREPELAQAIMRSVVGAVASGGVPVTVKMRSGWDEASKNAVELAQMAEDAGVSALTVHGRTRAQRFTGAVNPKDIAAVVRAVSIPVVANGDIASPEGARRMIDATGAAGVMIGRAARGNPWLLGRAREVLAGRADPGAPTIDERRRVVLKHLERHLRYWMREGKAERYALQSFRTHLRAYLQEPFEALEKERRAQAAQLLAQLVRDESAEALRENLEQFFCTVRRTN